MLFSPQAALLPRSIQRNDASSHWMPVYFWGSMAADHLGASLSRLDRFTNRASRADDPTRIYCCRFRPLALAGVASIQSYIKQYAQEELQ